MTSKSFTVLAIAGITIVGGVLAYAAYFDHKRRNDVEFRKQLRKDKKRAQKSVAQSQSSLAETASDEVTPAALQEALEQVKREVIPEQPTDKEAYFMSHVSMGEQLSAQGPSFYLPAAMSFYRALRVYPAPVELIVIYQKTVPAPIFKLVMDMTNLDVKSRVEGYYDVFPPKSVDVTIESRENRKVVVASKDFAAGELIYKENAVVTALDADIAAAGTHCTHCLRHIENDMSIPLSEESTRLPATFCSKACLLVHKSQSHSLLFTDDSPLPQDITPGPIPPDVIEQRKEAQGRFAAYIKKENLARPLLVARFVARQVSLETNKIVDSVRRTTPEKSDFMDSEEDGYLLADHIERLRSIDKAPSKEEHPLLVDVLRHALPGLEHFVLDERHTLLHGKMAYNVFGVTFDGGRDDKPEPEARPEDVEKTRTPYGTNRQIGSAFYTLSSYLSHSCDPSARPSFSANTAELHLVAARDVKKGDILSVAYVDVTQRPDETVLECRRRRRYELARGWQFACRCERCKEEANEMTEEDKATEARSDVEDGSKLEGSLNR